MPQHYEAPQVRMHEVSAESGFASSSGVNGSPINPWVEEDNQDSLNF